MKRAASRKHPTASLANDAVRQKRRLVAQVLQTYPDLDAFLPGALVFIAQMRPQKRTHAELLLKRSSVGNQPHMGKALFAYLVMGCGWLPVEMPPLKPAGGDNGEAPDPQRAWPKQQSRRRAQRYAGL